MSDICEPAKEIFLAAIDLQCPAEREAYIESACAGDHELLKRIRKLLEIQSQANSFLESPADANFDDTVEFEKDRYEGCRIGPYKVREQIGCGGMGVVYVAEQEKPLRRKVALKVIKPGMDSKAVLRRFAAERNALAIMNHPHIAKVLDAGTTDDGHPYFAMELVNGIPITEYCDEQRLAVNERLKLFVDVCHALQHAHQKGIIHRDIKPSNVLVTELDGKPMVKVIDFGVAKALNTSLTDQSIYTAYQTVIGTPLYMSPEQASFSAVDVDTRSDVYSLGVLLYELVTGTTPFTMDDFKQAANEEVFRIIREEGPARPSLRISSLGNDFVTRISQSRCAAPEQLRRIVRGDLDWIVMKALSKERGRRYDSANRFSEDVERYLSDDLVEARPPSLRYQLTKLYRKNRPFVIATGFVIAGLSVSLGLVARANQAKLAMIASQKQLIAKLRSIHSTDTLNAILSGQRQTAETELENYRGTLAPDELNTDRQLRLNQSIVNLFGNDSEREQAYETLKVLAEETPDDIVTRSLFVVSLLDSGREATYWKVVWELSDLEPTEHEELLFRGFALSEADPDAACTDLIEFVKRHPSKAMGHCKLSEAYHNRGVSSLERVERLELARKAVKHADLGVAITPDDHAYANTTHLAAATGLLDASLRGVDDARTEAVRDTIKVIKQHLQSKSKMVSSKIQSERLSSILALQSLGIDTSDINIKSDTHLSKNSIAEAVIKSVQLLYQMGQLKQCDQISRDHQRKVMPESALTFLVEMEHAAQQGLPINEVRDKIAARINTSTEVSDLGSLSAFSMLQILGEQELARRHAEKVIMFFQPYEAQVPAAKQLIPVYEWLLSDRRIPVDQLIADLDDSHAINHAAVCLGTDALLRGDRLEAVRLYGLAETSGQYEMYDSHWARILADRVLSSDDWPVWITSSADAN